MIIGDLVKLKAMNRRSPVRVGLIVDLIEKKCWRTEVDGPRIDWDVIKPEPHAVVSIKGSTLTIPVTDLEVINGSG